ncbi:MAG: AraC family transcriptional regulator [Bacteroidales bacterium]
MAKRKHKPLFIYLLNDFISNRFNQWALAISAVIVVACFFYFQRLKKINIFPGNENYNIYYYTDNANGGKSEITKFMNSDSLLELHFTLNEGFSSPYVGLTFGKKNGQPINIKYYNEFQIELESKTIKGIGLSLFTPNIYRKDSAGSREIYFFNNFGISPTRKTYTVDLNQLKIPDWWYELNKIPAGENISPDLGKVFNFNLGTAYSPELKSECSLKIYSISFNRNNRKLIIYLVLIEIGFVLLLLVIQYFRKYFNAGIKPLVIEYKPVSIENESNPAGDFLEFINHHFSDLNLTLDKVSQSTGINQRKIANTIQQSYRCNFKTYLNQIRINESKRLLRETDLNIGEVAFKSGFNNQSHFNRVFKNLTGQSPKQFRDTKF